MFGIMGRALITVTLAIGFSSLLNAPVQGQQSSPIYVEEGTIHPNDPHYPFQWNLLSNYYSYVATQVPMERPIKVAVVDTPIDRSNKDFEGVEFIDGFAGREQELGNPLDSNYYSFIENRSKPCRLEDGWYHHHCQHGTTVASIIAAKSNNGIGGAGIVQNVSIIENGLYLSNMDPAGKSADQHYSDVVKAVNTSIDLGARVINVSLGGGPDAGWDEVMDKAEKHGVVVVVSAGNSGDDGVNYRARHPKAISVAAVDANGYVTDFSSKGVGVDIAAPGIHISEYTQEHDKFGKETPSYTKGTSVAAPHVTATVALMLKKDPTLTPEQIRNKLFSTATKKSYSGGINAVGHGILNIPAALDIEIPDHVRNMPPPKPAPKPSPTGLQSLVPPLSRAHRFAGPTRIETAIDISLDLETSDWPLVVLARSDEFADSIAAGSLARIHHAPILITEKDTLNPAVREQLNKRQDSTGSVLIVGGENAISAQVENEIRALGRKTNRIGGTDRIDTSLKIADYVKSTRGYGHEFFSDGGNFQTSLLGGNLANRAQSGGVLILVDPKHVDKRVTDHMAKQKDAPRTYVGARSSWLEQLGIKSFIDGNIAKLSVLIAKDSGCSKQPVGIATAAAFPDGLVGGTHVARLGGCLFLVEADKPVEQSANHIKDYLSTNMGNNLFVYGGQSALPDSLIMNLVGK